MIVSTLFQPCYNLLHATLLHSGWWALDRPIGVILNVCFDGVA